MRYPIEIKIIAVIRPKVVSHCTNGKRHKANKNQEQ
jgi:hypothetical protein